MKALLIEESFYMYNDINRDKYFNIENKYAIEIVIMH